MDGEKENYSLEDYLSYKELLNNSIEQADQRNRMFYNDSYVHAAMVTESIIRLATQEKLPIMMYCGEFSIFRDRYSEKIHMLKEAIEPHDDSLMHEAWVKFDPYRDLINSLESYLSNGFAKFHLIVEKDISEIKNEKIWDIVETAINNQRLSIERLTENSGLSHFIVSGNSYRKESSDKEKTAICCFDDDMTAQVLSANFNTLKTKSIKCISV